MKKKRIHCPKCNKLMSSKTKKCKFCEKKLVKINKEISMASLYVGWVVSMLVFYMGIFYLRRSTLDVTTFTLYLLAVTIILGMAFFISLVKKLSEPKKKDDSKHWGKSTVIVFILFFVVLYNYETVEASLGFPPPQTQNSIVKTRATPKPTFRLTPTPKPTSKPQQTVKPTSNNTAKPNPDTPIHCPINESCGGGTIPLKASECEQSTCCETSPGNWEFMRNRNDCNNGSNEQNNTYEANNDYDYTYIKPETYPCTLYYSDNFEVDYEFNSKDDCAIEQKKINDRGIGPTPIPVATTKPDYSALLSECLNTAVITYNRSVQSANVKYGGGNSMGPLLIELAQEQLVRDEAYCNETYSN